MLHFRGKYNFPLDILQNLRDDFFSDFFELITFLPEFIVTTLVVEGKDFSSWMPSFVSFCYSKLKTSQIFQKICEFFFSSRDLFPQPVVYINRFHTTFGKPFF